VRRCERNAAYCRVGKGSLEPEHSLQAQTEYDKDMICPGRIEATKQKKKSDRLSKNV
jgi:hypothetical protein